MANSDILSGEKQFLSFIVPAAIVIFQTHYLRLPEETIQESPVDDQEPGYSWMALIERALGLVQSCELDSLFNENDEYHEQEPYDIESFEADEFARKIVQWLSSQAGCQDAQVPEPHFDQLSFQSDVRSSAPLYNPPSSY